MKNNNQNNLADQVSQGIRNFIQSLRNKLNPPKKEDSEVKLVSLEAHSMIELDDYILSPDINSNQHNKTKFSSTEHSQLHEALITTHSEHQKFMIDCAGGESESIVNNKNKQMHSSNPIEHHTTIWKRSAFFILYLVQLFAKKIKLLSPKYQFSRLQHRHFKTFHDVSCDFYYYFYRGFFFRQQEPQSSRIALWRYVRQMMYSLMGSRLGRFFSSENLVIKTYIRLQRKLLIKPTSKKKLWWDVLLFIALSLNVIYLPIKVTFFVQDEDDQFLWLGKWLLPAMVVDILLSLNQVYYEQGMVIVDRWKIVQNYFNNSSSFVSDFSVVALLYFLSPNPHFTFFVLLLFFLLTKLYHVKNGLEDLSSLNDQRQAYYDLFKLTIFILYISHLYGCFFYFIARVQEQHTNETSWIEKQNLSNESSFAMVYVNSVYWAAVTVLTVGYGDITPGTLYEKTYTIFIAVITCGIFAYLVNEIGQIIHLLSSQKNALRTKLQMIQHHMAKNNISEKLQTKVKKYITYKIAEDLESNLDSKSQQVLNELPTFIRKELYQEKYFNILQSEPILKQNFSQSFLSQLAHHMKETIIGPEQVIYEPGQVHNTLYFLRQGQVEQYIKVKTGPEKPFTALNRLTCSGGQQRVNTSRTLNKRSFFSDSAPLMGARTLSLVQLCYIEQEEFLKVAQDFPDDFETYYFLRDSLNVYQDINSIGKKCELCEQFTHTFEHCNLLQFSPNQTKLFAQCKLQQNERQDRKPFNRELKNSYNTLHNSGVVKNSQIIWLIENNPEDLLEDELVQIVNNIYSQNEGFEGTNPYSIIKNIMKINSNNSMTTNSEQLQEIYENVEEAKNRKDTDDITSTSECDEISSHLDSKQSFSTHQTGNNNAVVSFNNATTIFNNNNNNDEKTSKQNLDEEAYVNQQVSFQEPLIQLQRCQSSIPNPTCGLLNKYLQQSQQQINRHVRQSYTSQQQQRENILQYRNLRASRISHYYIRPSCIGQDSNNGAESLLEKNSSAKQSVIQQQLVNRKSVRQSCMSNNNSQQSSLCNLDARLASANMAQRESTLISKTEFMPLLGLDVMKVFKMYFPHNNFDKIIKEIKKKRIYTKLSCKKMSSTINFLVNLKRETTRPSRQLQRRTTKVVSFKHLPHSTTDLGD